MRVLLVDDNESVRMAMALTLADMGSEVREVAHGHVAMVALEEEHFDLVITDLRLPGSDGIAIARTARARFPDIAVLVVTGNVGDAEERAIAELGALLLHKPFRGSALAAAVRAVCGLS